MSSRWPLILLVLVIALGAALLAQRTEWVKREVALGPQGEARNNPLYATHQLVQKLGAKVVRPTDGLAHFPPSGGTLYLRSNEWNLFPGRVEQLQQWVEQGGHLVVSSDLIGQSGLSEWVPVTADKASEQGGADEEEEDSDPDPSPIRVKTTPAERAEPRCHTLSEQRTAPPRYPGKVSFKTCVVQRQTVHTNSPLLWSVGTPSGLAIVRVQAGSGSITVHNLPTIFNNRQLLQGDHALLVAALLQATPGREIWFVHEENRPPFLSWLWANAWIAVVAGLLALAAALWRGALRFGPGLAPSLPVRRSMREQISGTAQFLQRHGTQALHRAALRALDEAALMHVRRYDSLTLTERAHAIANRTGLSAPALAQAMQSETPHRKHLGTTVQLLETARRRLRNAADPLHRPPLSEGPPDADPT